MNCSHCGTDTANIAFEETSHLGKRPICYSCIGKRDEARMKRTNCIILYPKDSRLVNYTHTLSFEVISKEVKPNCTFFHFMVNSKNWKGVMYPSVSNQVSCRKV